MFKIQSTTSFDRKYKALKNKDSQLAKQVVKTISLLHENPLFASLHTHKVSSARYGIRFSSKVTGDIRIIWDYDKNENLLILLLDLGGHSGKKRVYK